MHKINVRLSSLIFVLSVVLQYSGIAQAAQTLNRQKIEDIDDIVKSVNGELAISKKGLITIRGGNDNDHTYVDVFATVFSKDATPSKARKIFTYPNSGSAIDSIEFPSGDGLSMVGNFYSPNYFAPVVSRRLYNGKRAFMFHNIAPNGQLKYYFKTLSNTITSHDNRLKLDERVDSVQISDFGEYTPEKFSDAAKGFAEQVYGTGAMEVKGYENEIFVVASGANHPGNWDKSTVRLEFFAISADSEGNMTRLPLTTLTHETPFRDAFVGGGAGGARIVSLAVGDFDGDKYNNEVALMINTRPDLKLFVYRLILSNGNLVLRSLGDPKGILVHSTKQWGYELESQPVSDTVAGDFDGDGTSEIAVLFKDVWRAEKLKHHKGWPEGPYLGNIHCKVHKWNAETGTFDTAETIKDYHGEKDDKTTATGVVGLRAVTADLNGDGMDEIATVLVGYSHRKDWNGVGMRRY